MGFPNVAHYRAMAARLGISQRVRFTGAIAYPQAPAYLALGDLAVAPKRSATEGSGKLLPYMSMALPIVATDTPVHREYLSEDAILISEPQPESPGRRHRAGARHSAGAARQSQSPTPEGGDKLHLGARRPADGRCVLSVDGYRQTVNYHNMNRLLALLLGVYLLLGVAYSFATPVFEASDEIWHVAVVRELLTRHRLPVQDADAPGPWAQEGSQPPLYYALSALITAGIDQSDYEAQRVLNPFPKIGAPGATDNLNLVAHPPDQAPWQGGVVLAVYLIRWLSVAMGAVTVYLTYRLVAAIWPQRSDLAFLAAALVAFNPMFLFISAAVNNDNLLVMLTTLALVLLIRDMQSQEEGMRWGATVALGVVIGLATITKVSGAVLIPIAALALTLTAWRRHAWGDWVRRGLVLALIVAAIGGWWYLRNYSLYGELIGLQRCRKLLALARLDLVSSICGRRDRAFGTPTGACLAASTSWRHPGFMPWSVG